MRKSNTISMRLDNVTKEKLEHLANLEKCSKTDIVVRMINMYNLGDYTKEQKKKESMKHLLELFNIINEMDDDLGKVIKLELEEIQCLIL